ncbi:MAG: gluconokinase [Proteobacteria bacterium]|nr:gluconokinase [Pseudomonadota bacterium]
MGVSGAGKTTIGARLAAALAATFHEGDQLHPPENVAKMARGEPLSDDDRGPWLRAIAAAIGCADAAGENAVFACSALKHNYRDILRAACPALKVVHLAGSEALIRGRLEARRDHFMPPTLLPSQFRALEPPDPAEHPIVIDIAAAPDVIVAAICAALARASASAADSVQPPCPPR